MSEKQREKWDRWPADFRPRALERMKTSQSAKTLAEELGGSPSTVDPRDRRIRDLQNKAGELEGASVARR
jgi:transposase-like protein